MKKRVRPPFLLALAIVGVLLVFSSFVIGLISGGGSPPGFGVVAKVGLALFACGMGGAALMLIFTGDIVVIPEDDRRP